MYRLAFPLFSIAVLLGVLPAALPSGKAIVTQGGSYEIKPRLRVPTEHRHEMGRLAFTAVYQTEGGSWADVLHAYISGTAAVVPAEAVRPRNMSQEELNETNRRLIEESKPLAAAVALRAAGYEVHLGGEGADVTGTVQGRPADGVLRKGDLIVALDGAPVETTADLIAAIVSHKVGDMLRLTVLRDGAVQEVEVGTVSTPSAPGRPLVGIYIQTRGFHVDLPFTVEIDTRGVGGSSAGLMFALGILDAITAGDLTRGHFVAGTGTIGSDGGVGPVGGAAEKVTAAEMAQAVYFLVPRANVEEAQKRARRVQVVPVEQFADAVAFLCALEPTAEAARAPLPAPCTTS